MKKNIQVKEGNLIDRLNANVKAKSEATAKEPYVEPKCEIADDPIKDTYMEGSTERRTYKVGEGPEIIKGCVTLSPRYCDGQIIDIDGFDDNPEDRRDSRAAVNANGMKVPFGKLVEIEKARLLKQNPALIAALKELLHIENEGTRPRTHESTLEVDLPFPGEVKAYEEVNHPQHYNNYDVEVIDMMERVFGKEATITFCKLNAFKYRMRAGTKPGQDADKDLNKEQWYLDKMNEMRQR